MPRKFLTKNLTIKSYDKITEKLVTSIPHKIVKLRDNESFFADNSFGMLFTVKKYVIYVILVVFERILFFRRYSHKNTKMAIFRLLVTHFPKGPDT